MLLFSDVLYKLARYARPIGPMCLRCLMLTLPGPVELLFWLCVVVSVRLVVGSLSVFLYVSVCFVCFMLDCWLIDC